MKNIKSCLILFLLIFCISAALKGNLLKAQDKTISYLALGDSYTIGESVDIQQRWPVQLAAQLKQEGIKISEPRIIAKTGWTTDELLDSLQTTKISSSYDLVSLLIGVNNQYRGYNIKQYKKEFELLLEKAIKYAGGDTSNVFVVSIPDYGVTPFGQQKNPVKIAAELNNYNAMAKNICKKYRISFIDITGISRKASDDNSLIAGDKLHPSARMYSLWVQKMLPTVQKILSHEHVSTH